MSSLPSASTSQPSGPPVVLSEAMSWTEMLAVDREAVLGTDEASSLLAAAWGRRADQARQLLDGLRPATNTRDGFRGLAADGLAALVGDVTSLIEPVATAYDELAAAYNAHAGAMAELVWSDGDARRVAAHRWRAVQAAERDVRYAQNSAGAARALLDDVVAASAGTMEPGAEALVADSRSDLCRAEAKLGATRKRLEAAQRELEACRTTYQNLRAEEAMANSVLAGRLRSVSDALPVAEPLRECYFYSPLYAPHVDIVWDQLHPVFLDHGYDVQLPDADVENPVECVSVDTSGQITLWVAGPHGGAFRVGRDISAGLFRAVVDLLDGRIPDERPFNTVLDLNPAEFAALHWAYRTNFTDEEMVELATAGVNGNWDAYRDGGVWRPGPIRVLNAVDLGTKLASVSQTPVSPSQAVVDAVATELAPPSPFPEYVDNTPAFVIKQAIKGIETLQHPAVAEGFDPVTNRPVPLTAMEESGVGG